MGDRGVIECVERNGGVVYLYTHWRAHELTTVVADGLANGISRWGDESYLNRILFDTLTGLEGQTEGFGIATWCPGDAYLKITVDHERQTVQVFSRDFGDEWLPGTEEYGFDEFVRAMKDPEVLSL